VDVLRSPSIFTGVVELFVVCWRTKSDLVAACASDVGATKTGVDVGTKVILEAPLDLPSGEEAEEIALS
jgi:hypothetical protein